MKSIKEQVIDAYDKHYVSSCGEVVDLTLEKVEKIIDYLSIKYGGKVGKYEEGSYECLKLIKELKLSLKGGKTK